MIQNRFKHLKDKELELIQQDVDRKWKELKKRAEGN